MGVFSVPVTIGVNEEEIARNIEANVENQVLSKITKEVENIMFERRGYYGFNDESPLRQMIKDEVLKVVESEREQIVKLAADILADKLSRTKAVREAAGETAKKVYTPAWVRAQEKGE